ncbi:MAG: hypothetical protein H6811_05635 [Phycisphaeraceae bacterium]|nr:hypothetical protein [Phycisphaeraceae bacterium]
MMTSSHRRLCCVWNSATLLALASGHSSAGPVRFEAIALSGDPAPIAGATFASFDAPRFAGVGVQFWAALESDGSAPASGLFLASPVDARLVQGDAVEWIPEPTTLDAIPLAAAGPTGVLVAGTVADLGEIRSGFEASHIGLFQTHGPVVETLLQKNQPAPGLPEPLLLRNVYTPSLSASGRVAALASIFPESSSDQRTGIWSDRSGDLTLEYFAGDVISDPAGDVTLRHIANPVFLPDHALAFRATLESQSFPEQDYALISDSPGVAQIITRRGDIAPGTDRAFEELDVAPAASADGALAFWARVVPDDGANTGIWSTRPGLLSLEVLEGQAAPGAQPATFGSFSRAVQINDRGELAFWAAVDDAPGQEWGIWSDARADALRPVVRRGQALYGLDPEITVGIISDPILDPRGQLFAFATLTGPGVTPDTDRALLFQDTAARLNVLVREGDVLDVRGDGSDLRTVAEVIFDSGHIHSGHAQVDDDRRLLVIVRFADDSTGLFRLAIPAPTDIDGDGDTDSDDYFAFLDDLAGRSGDGDFNRDGAFDVADYLAFLDALTEG